MLYRRRKSSHLVFCTVFEDALDEGVHADEPRSPGIIKIKNLDFGFSNQLTISVFGIFHSWKFIWNYLLPNKQFINICAKRQLQVSVNMLNFGIIEKSCLNVKIYLENNNADVQQFNTSNPINISVFQLSLLYYNKESGRLMYS